MDGNMNVENNEKDIQEESEVIEPKRKKGKIILVTLLVAVIVLGTVAAAFGISNISGLNIKEIEKDVLVKNEDGDGTSYILLENGDYITVEENTEEAYITPDRKNVVVLYEDGVLSVANKKMSKKETVCENCESVGKITDKGFIYNDKDGKTFRYTFKGGSTYEYEKSSKMIFAKDSLSALYVNDSGKVYTVKYDSTEPVEIASGEEYRFNLSYVSDEADVTVFEKIKDGMKDVFVNEKDTETNILSVSDGLGAYTAVESTADENLILIYNTEAEYLWIKRPDEAPVKARLGAKAGYLTLFSESGSIRNTENGKRVDSIYALISSNSKFYAINMDGDRELLVKDVKSATVANEKLFYADKENDLYVAELNKNTVEESEKIASDIAHFITSPDGKFTYYMKNYDADVFNLYLYKYGEDDSVKIDKTDSAGGIRISEDGKNLYYFKDTEIIDEFAYLTYGTLMQWKYGDDKPHEVAKEVITLSPESGLKSFYLDPNRINFAKYVDVSEDKLYYNGMFYNGNKVKKVVSDLIIEKPTVTP